MLAKCVQNVHETCRPGEGKEHVDIPQYGANIVEIYKRLSAKAKKVVWTTTTPCPNVTTSMGRTDAKVNAYNAEAIASLQRVYVALYCIKCVLFFIVFRAKFWLQSSGALTFHSLFRRP
jgi:hypothetical protein